MNYDNLANKVFLVIPSVRENCFLEFLQNWKEDKELRDWGDWDQIILVEDNPQKTFKIPEEFPASGEWIINHFSHEDIEKDFGEDNWIISRKDSAIRSYGFWKAVQMGADWILTLDDDCAPHRDYERFLKQGGICSQHFCELDSFSVWSYSAGVRTRGIPYKNIGKIKPVLNMGLWVGNGDFDSIQSLTYEDHQLTGFRPSEGSFLANSKQRYPFCGMNVMFHKSVLPAMYFPLMGQGQPFGRYDDIWCGVIFQKVFEHLNLSWSYGQPWIHHTRASNLWANLKKEAPGFELNEILWEKINFYRLTGVSIHSCMNQIGEQLRRENDAYLSNLGRAIERWVYKCL